MENVFVFIEILFKMLLFKGGVLIYAEHCTLSRSRKVWKASPWYSICHQWFNRNFMKLREYFLYGNKTNNDFIQQLGTVTSPLCQHSAILEIIPWTQNTYTSISASSQGCVFFVDLCSDLNANSAPLYRSVRILHHGDNLQNGATAPICVPSPHWPSNRPPHQMAYQAPVLASN